MPQYADIVFSTAVRQAFTYQVPERLQDKVKSGMRVWVPFQRRKTIGMVVGLHDETPSFNTRKIERLLDDQPILSSNMLRLTRWIHRFYYCSWGEVIQAALPAGLNFYAEQYIRVPESASINPLDDQQKEIAVEVRQDERYLLKEAKKAVVG